jgi:hypothetical protein
LYSEIKLKAQRGSKGERWFSFLLGGSFLASNVGVPFPSAEVPFSTNAVDQNPPDLTKIRQV